MFDDPLMSKPESRGENEILRSADTSERAFITNKEDYALEPIKSDDGPQEIKQLMETQEVQKEDEEYLSAENFHSIEPAPEKIIEPEQKVKVVQERY